MSELRHSHHRIATNHCSWLVCWMLAGAAASGCSGAGGSSERSASTTDSATADDDIAEDVGGPRALADVGTGHDVVDLHDSGAPADVGFVDAGAALDVGQSVDTATILQDVDAAVMDSGTTGDTGPADAGKPDTAGGCAPPSAFDYKCDAKKPATCPGGSCVLGMCVGPKLDQDRWKDCGDGKCGACETASSCPADCGKAPVMTGKKDYSGQQTITVWVHGFYNKTQADIAKLTYGEAVGCSGPIKAMAKFGVKRPCGDTKNGAKKPNHIVKVEYYGATPAAWLSKQDIAEIDKYPFDKGALGLQRYALIVAKFTKHHLAISGATHVNFGCHSMGCLITRHLIENDYEKLASSNKIVRWSTNTGVIAGARLARLYDNPEVQKTATSLGFELSDFVLMNPDYVMDVTAAWDHKLYAGNNPLFKGILMHHTAATDPKIKTALNIQLLDLDNPADEPNDGIMYTLDQYFSTQKSSGVTTDTAGAPVPSTHTFTWLDHMTNPKSDAAALLSAAGLFHKRKVVITLKELELYDDLEKDNPLDIKNTGDVPADIAIEAAVRYNPYVKTTFQQDVLVHNMRSDHRSAPLFSAKQGDKLKPATEIFAGPVFDGMKSLKLRLWLLEMDWYPRFGVKEWLFDKYKQLAAFDDAVPLKNGTFEIKNAKVRAVVQVRMHQMY